MATPTALTAVRARRVGDDRGGTRVGRTTSDAAGAGPAFLDDLAAIARDHPLVVLFFEVDERTGPYSTPGCAT
ncbi:hypothetical protein D7294_22210 [Streptomyces hoynatensis]|uniref:Uncharacterized protein n=1 Tax=Streptomyces hoynatensis TaxID=1141874 RepID=A0A3A9YTB7_9ACTN|nr:hypothetical protein D7294_22210 [Streptomyces hoynatensis]